MDREANARGAGREVAMDAKAELREILRANSVLAGRFVLASGKVSTYYLDCKRTTLSSPRGLHLTAELIFEQIWAIDPRPDAIGGLTIGAAPLSVAVSQMALGRGWELPIFVVRDERKGHGTERVIEGGVKAGWNVVIVDDVMTTGNSVQKAINAVVEQGAHVSRVIVLVDRDEGGRDTLKKHDLHIIFSYRDLLG
jgi:orotate phosphoribosyltransferase